MAAKSRGIPQKIPAAKQSSQQIQAKLQLGLAHHQRGQIEQAKTIYQDVLKAQPKNFDCLHLLGVIAIQTGNHELAVKLIGDAIALNPDFALAYSNRGNALKGLNRLDEALASYDKALVLNPNDAETCNNRGNALKELRRLDDALASYDKALSLKSGYAKAYANRGVVLQDLKRLDEALASYDKALALNPNDAETYNNRGNALKELRRLDEALADYDKALSLRPEYAEVYFNCAIALQDLLRLDEARACYDKALSLKPDYEFLLGTCLYIRMMLCDWTGLSEDLRRYEEGIANSEKVSMPFPVLCLLDKPALQKKAAQIYVESMYPKTSSLGAIGQRIPGDKIRIGYYSADFHNHATAHLMAELFEAHNHDKFEIYGFSFGPDTDDEVRQRISSTFDRFVDVRHVSDREVANMSRQLDIDIAVDLKGHTKDQRTGIFAEGCAPVQVSYLGYPGTMGADYIHYVIADRMVLPENQQSNFTEQVVYLPHSYQVNDSRRKISTRIFTRQEVGLPDTGFVFCCFNNNYKILPAIFDVWMRILKAVEGSVLWLLEDNPTAARNLRKEADARGVDPRRLVFAQRMKLDEHLARHRLADLFLDTLPCAAHTTASDALWAELPVLTCMGQSFAGRVAASLLNAVGLQELIVQTLEEYEAKAIALAHDPVRLQEIKRTIQENKRSVPLFNGRKFAKDIEAAYEQMFARFQAGLEPAPIAIQDECTSTQRSVLATARPSRS